MTAAYHLLIEQGKEKGRTIRIPAGGARLGRSSKNDIVVVDPLLSRYHCRFSFSPEGKLHVTDLGSANATQVNGAPVEERTLRRGDAVALGENILRVIHDEPLEDGEAFDIGLASSRTQGEEGKRRPAQMWLSVLLLLAICVIAAYFLLMPKERLTSPAVETRAATAQPIMELSYEKVDARPDNIFRYQLDLTPDYVLTVRIDDLKSDRHIRKETTVDASYLRQLTDSLLNSGFFSLSDEYAGINPGVLESWDISITIGKQTHRTKVINRTEPDTFKNVREDVEQFARNELGLWAVQFPPDTLRKMAREAYLLGLKLFDEQDVTYGNLSSSIRSFQEAEWYLQTLDPKPDYYKDLLAKKEQAQGELDGQYRQRIFQVERAMQLKEWQDAARDLRIICELIPSRSDERYQDARNKLVEMERRIQAEK